MSPRWRLPVLVRLAVILDIRHRCRIRQHVRIEQHQLREARPTVFLQCEMICVACHDGCILVPQYIRPEPAGAAFPCKATDLSLLPCQTKWRDNERNMVKTEITNPDHIFVNHIDGQEAFRGIGTVRSALAVDQTVHR